MMRPFLVFIFSFLVVMTCFAKDRKIDSLQSELKKTLPDTVKIKVLNKLAKLHYDQKEKAFEHSRKAIQLSYGQTDPWFLGQSYHTLGRYQFDMGDFIDGSQHLDSALKYYNKANDSTNATHALSSKGLCFWKLGQYENAIKIFTTILKQYQNRNSAIEIPALNNLGLIYMEQKRTDDGIRIFEETLEKATHHKNDKGIMLAHNNLSVLYRHKKKFQKAITSLRKALQIAKKLDHIWQIGRSYSNLGATFTKMNQIDSAKSYLLKAYRYGKKHELHPGLAKTTWHIAELYEQTNQFDMARKYAFESLQIAKQNQLTDDIRYAFEILFAIEKKAGNPAKAIQMADSLTFWTDSINKANLAKEIAVAEANYKNNLLRAETALQASKIERLDERQSYLIKIFFAIFLLTLLSFLLWRSAFIRKRTKRDLENEILHAKKLTESIERYRQKRATELHDDVGQDLLLAQQSIELDSPTERSLNFILRALNKIRKISKDEYPYELNYVGLKRSLEYLIDLVEQNTDLIISESFEVLDFDIPQEKRLNIYRIVQEMINNSIKNKKSDSVFIGFDKKEDSLQLTYKDNGPGFDFEQQLHNAKSIGLKSIVNRVRLLRGELKFVPSKEENKYIVDIPI